MHVQSEGGEDSDGLQLQTYLRTTQATHKILVEHAKKQGTTVLDADDEDEKKITKVPESFAWPLHVRVWGARQEC